jgi:hypothetical protein
MTTYTSIKTALANVQDGQIFAFTFGTLWHFPQVMFVNRVPYSVVNGKPAFRLYID